VAAFIAEPISHSSGESVPAPDYWPTIRGICDKYGVLLICDEVITGFGRTGKMFGIEHWDVEPDIMTVAKGLTSGYMPMGAAIAKAEIAEAFKPTTKEAFQHVMTFGGHAVASAAAMANLDIIEQEGLVENSAAMGAYLKEGLNGLRHHPSIGDVRGLGLMCAVELTKNRKARAGFNEQERRKLRQALTKKFLDAGISMSGGDRIPILPPLVVQKHEIERIVDAIDRSLSELEEELPYWH
jgi:adenosylmethionine-8-amino-7-oxononanoate aminotransferase